MHAREVSDWLCGLGHKAEPASVFIGRRKFWGARYRHRRCPSEERFYLLGDLPLRGFANGVCFIKGVQWFLVGFVRADVDEWVMKKHHPFGPNFIIGRKVQDSVVVSLRDSG